MVWPERWIVERAQSPPGFRRGSCLGCAPDRLQPRAPAGLSFPWPVKQALDALIAREFASPDLLQRQMHARNLLGRQRRRFLFCRQLNQEIGHAILLLGGQLANFCDGFFKALCHVINLASRLANFHVRRLLLPRFVRRPTRIRLGALRVFQRTPKDKARQRQFFSDRG